MQFVLPKWMSDPNWWSAIGTVSAVVIAIFGQTFWAWWRRPKLDLSIRMRPPDCHKTFLTNEKGTVVADCYYFRVLVRNGGKRRAHDVELHAERLEREVNGQYDQYEEVTKFPPMRLLWSHVGVPALDISPGVSKHCDLGYIELQKGLTVDETARLVLGEDNRLRFTLEVKPNQGGWDIGAGVYRLHVILAAAEVTGMRFVLKITYDGRWELEEAQMFAAIQIRLPDRSEGPGLLARIHRGARWLGF